MSAAWCAGLRWRLTATVSEQGLGHLVVGETERVRLRRKHMQDALNDFRWRRDPEIARYDAAMPLTKTFTEFLDQFERDLYGADPLRRMFALEIPDGTQIGNIMYYNADDSRLVAELGISIALPEHRGRGLGTEAVVSFLRFIWNELPFRVIYLHTLQWNERAIHCFEKAGFSPTARVLRQREWFLRMEVRREWWLMWEQEGRFADHGRNSESAEAAPAGGLTPPV